MQLVFDQSASGYENLYPPDNLYLNDQGKSVAVNWATNRSLWLTDDRARQLAKNEVVAFESSEKAVVSQ